MCVLFFLLQISIISISNFLKEEDEIAQLHSFFIIKMLLETHLLYVLILKVNKVDSEKFMCFFYNLILVIKFV